MVWKRVYIILRVARRFVLSLLFISDQWVLQIENMSAVAFYKQAKPAVVLKLGGGVIQKIALFSYRDPLVKALVWNMKFRKNKRCFELAEELFYMKIREFIAKEMNITDVFILPVPISSSRKRDRGYNHMEYVAYEFRKLDKDMKFSYLIDTIKKKNVSPQTSLSRADRIINLKDSFSVIGSVRDKNIIIIDDVITTGATLEELGKVLLQAGAKSVIGIALAH